MSKNNNSDKKLNGAKLASKLENELLTEALIAKGKQIKGLPKDFNILVKTPQSDIAPETRIKINNDMIKSLEKGGVSPKDIDQIKLESRLKAKDLMPKIEQEFKKRQDQQTQKPAAPYKRETFNRSSSMPNLRTRETIAAARTSDGALKVENNLRDKEPFTTKESQLKRSNSFDPKKMMKSGATVTNNTIINTSAKHNSKSQGPKSQGQAR